MAAAVAAAVIVEDDVDERLARARARARLFTRALRHFFVVCCANSRSVQVDWASHNCLFVHVADRCVTMPADAHRRAASVIESK